MKNIIKILLFAAVASMGITACSDNVNDRLIPSKITKVLMIKPEVSDAIFSDDKLSLGAGSYNITVAVESNTRWKPVITYVNGGGWCESDVFTGSGNGSFTLSIRDNMTEERSCEVTVYVIDEKGEIPKEDGNLFKYFTITQVASQVRLTPSSVEPFAAEKPRSQEFRVLANEIGWTLNVSYDGEDAAEFVSVNNMVNMQEEGANSFSGYGDASFSITLKPNRTAANRIAFLSLSSSVGNYSVEIQQTKSEYTFDVSPLDNQVVPAEGGTIDFGVLSPLCGWTVASSADWISFSPDRGDKSDNRVTSVATIAPNSYGKEHNADVYFTPDDNRYPSLSVRVVQRGFDLLFSASPDGTMGVLMPEAQTKSFSLDSRFNWEMTLPDWISSSSMSGTPSDSERNISLSVSANTTGVTRNGTLTIRPLVTEFGGGVQLDPKVLGIDSIRFSITQFGGQEPAISTPWLDEGYTQTTATVEFNFYSPYYPITVAGLQWRKEGETGWNSYREDIDNRIDGRLSVDLTGLDPATKYEARGFVVYSDGQVKYGAVSFPFTTGGKRPGSEDNPTPGE